MKTEELCYNCSGSGEGQYDGSRCQICKGKGVLPTEDEYELECQKADYEYEIRKEERLLGNS